MGRSLRYITFVALILFGSRAFALPANCNVGTNVYYVDNVGGADSHSQTQAKSKSIPWAHAPYMASFTGSYSHTAGDCFVFKGGDTWVYSDYFVLSSGGTSGSPDYYGVDTTWYSGSSWMRPVFDIKAQQPNLNSYGASQIVETSANYITFDSWEFIHSTCTAGHGTWIFQTDGRNGITVTNSYFHAFENPTGGCGTGNNNGNQIASWIYECVGGCGSSGSFDHNVVDGTDGTGEKGYMTIVMDPAPAVSVAYNVVHDLCSGFGGDFTLVHDNLIYDFGANSNPDGFDCVTEGIHAHAIRAEGDATVYNNVIHDANDGLIKTNPTNGSAYYIFNNVVYHNGYSDYSWYDIDLCDNGAGACNNGVVYVWNNTLECVQDSGTAGVCFRLENAVNTLWLANEHHISVDNSGGLSGTNLASKYSFNTSQNLFQTTAQAIASSYTASNSYASTSATSPTTVVAGANLTANWSSGISTDSSTVACTQGTAAGNLPAGVVQVECPMHTVETRPTTGPWNVGAYQFPTAGTSGTVTPPSGLTAAVQ